MLNFTTKSAKEPAIYDLLFLIAIYSPKNNNKHASNRRNQEQSSQFTITEVFPGLGPILTTGLKCCLTVKRAVPKRLLFQKVILIKDYPFSRSSCLVEVSEKVAILKK